MRTALRRSLNRVPRIGLTDTMTGLVSSESNTLRTRIVKYVSEKKPVHGARWLVKNEDFGDDIDED